MFVRRPLLPYDSSRKDHEHDVVGSPVHLHRLIHRTRLVARRYPLMVGVGVVALTLAFIWQCFSTCVLFPSLYYRLFPLPRIDPTAAPRAWMDPREIALVEATIAATTSRTVGGTGSSRRPTRMLEYGSGYSTFHFSRLVDEYISIEHDLIFCDGLFELATSAGLGPNEFDAYHVWRDETGDVMMSRLRPARPMPSGVPRVRVYCVAPTAGIVRTEDSSWFAACTCCFKRCPTKAAQYEDYMRLPAWIPRLTAAHRLAATDTERRLFGPHALDRSAATSRMAARDLFPNDFADASATDRNDAWTFDVVLVDGRARPQCAWFAWPLVRTGSVAVASANDPSTADTGGRVLMHDWNRRAPYHAALEVYDIESIQAASEQPGGGGLVVLTRRVETNGGIESDQLPDWWL